MVIFKKICLGFLIIILGGCTFNNNREPKEVIKKFDNLALKGMKEKYNQDFIIKERDYTKKTNSYNCIMETKDGSVKDISVTFLPFTKEMADSYSEHYFKSDAIKITDDILKTKKYLKKYEIKFGMSYVTKKWTKKDKLDDFLKDKEVKSHNEIELQLEDGLNDEEYAVQVDDLLNDLYGSKVNHQISIYIKDNINIFRWAITPSSDKKFTYSELVDMIKERRVDSEEMDAFYKTDKGKESKKEEKRKYVKAKKKNNRAN